MYLLIESAGALVQQPLPADEGVIGSAADCAVSVAGSAPRHARFRVDGDALELEQLDAPLGVAGSAVAQHRLRPGTELALGEARLWLVREPDEVEVRLAKPAPQDAQAPTSGPAARLALLADMARTIGRDLDLAEVYARMLSLVARAIAPEHAALVQRESDGSLRILAAHSAAEQGGRPARPLQLSSTLVARVIERGEALLVADATSDAQTRGVRSIMRQRIRTVACVPYAVRGVVVGALYVDSRSKSLGGFEEADLDYLIALSHLGAAAAQSVKTVETLAKLEREVAELRGGAAAEIVGEAPATRKLRELLSKVARSSLPVLVAGERGTGKELAASAIHRSSERASAPFVAVNCAAIPESLTESAFFGHLRGAFTGAERDQPGYFRQADGGTLFLDEVADLRAGAQAALLRALQQGEVLPVGATTPVAVDVRVVCATNRDLAEAASRGEFRHDLLDRLEVLRIELPPLRERPDDIPLLAAHFAAGRVTRVSARALELLCAYRWPGNIRELRNVIERAAVLGDGETIWPEDLPPALRAANAADEHLASLESVERDHIIRVLRRTRGNITQAATILGVQRLTVYKKLDKYALDAADFKQG
ncbi:MAG: sigma 54-interacting transcriptional regulator [Myxococcales bacterium]|nr:sigma 54-interacting transcriptional regulator [Myxococcales bacterium]